MSSFKKWFVDFLFDLGIFYYKTTSDLSYRSAGRLAIFRSKPRWKINYDPYGPTYFFDVYVYLESKKKYRFIKSFKTKEEADLFIIDHRTKFTEPEIQEIYLKDFPQYVD